MEEAWMNFMETGRVTDYLRFKQTADAICCCAGSLDTAERGREYRPDGTEYHGDRNGLKGNADWRL